MVVPKTVCVLSEYSVHFVYIQCLVLAETVFGLSEQSMRFVRVPFCRFVFLAVHFV